MSWKFQWLLAQYLESNGAGKIDESGKGLMESCGRHKLCVTNTFFKTMPHHQVSWQYARLCHWHQLYLSITRTSQLAIARDKAKVRKHTLRMILWASPTLANNLDNNTTNNITYNTTNYINNITTNDITNNTTSNITNNTRNGGNCGRLMEVEGGWSLPTLI